MSSSPLPADESSVVEFRIAASPARTPLIRALACDLAARADFDLDAISDLRVAVDEACNSLVEVARLGSILTCAFMVLPDRMDVEIAVVPDGDFATVPTDTFAWQVLEATADKVAAALLPGADGMPDRLSIRLTKWGTTEPRRL